MIKFTDGMQFNTSGQLRIVREKDGLYVVGNGMLVPVNSMEEAKQIIKDSMEESNKWSNHENSMLEC